MKRLFIFAFVASLGLASCKKDWDCDCTYTDAQGNEAESTSQINDAKKSDAEDACDDVESTWQQGGGDASCELSQR